MSRDGCVALSRGATVLSAVCDCGISGSYSLTVFYTVNLKFGISKVNGLGQLSSMIFNKSYILTCEL